MEAPSIFTYHEITTLQAYVYPRIDWANIRRNYGYTVANLAELYRNDPTFAQMVLAMMRRLPVAVSNSSIGIHAIFRFDGVIENDDMDDIHLNRILNRDASATLYGPIDFIAQLLLHTEYLNTMASATFSGGAPHMYSNVNVFISRAYILGYCKSKEEIVSAYYDYLGKAIPKTSLKLFAAPSLDGMCGVDLIIHIFKQNEKINVDKSEILKDERFCMTKHYAGDNIIWNVNSLFLLIRVIVDRYNLSSWLPSTFEFWQLKNNELNRLEVTSYQVKNHGVVQYRLVLYGKHWYLAIDGFYAPNKRPRLLEREVCKHGCGLEITNVGMRMHSQYCIRVEEDESLKYFNINEHIQPIQIESLSYEDFIQVSNIKYQWMVDRMESKQPSIMIGGGGMGKSYMIAKLMQTYPDGIVLTPTATAASGHDKAVTWHSYFGYGQCDDYSVKFDENNKPRFIVIDEISMVTASDLDKMSFAICKKTNGVGFFGGIPVILTGDPVQLPPVEPNHDYIDFWFTHHMVRRIVMSGGLQQLMEPFRYIEKGSHVDEEGIQFANVLEKLRCGIPTPELVKMCGGIHPPSFFIHYTIPKEQVIICATNKQVIYIANSIYGNYGGGLVYSNGLHGELRLVEGVEYIVSNNQAVQNPLVFNGTRCTLLKTQLFHLEMQTKEGLIFNLPININTSKLNSVDLVYAKIMTIHRSQGFTFESVIVVKTCMSKKEKDKGANWHPGQMYVAVSRVRRAKDLHFVLVDDNRKMKIFKNRKLFSVYDIAKKFAIHPRMPLPVNIFYGKGGYFYNKDTEMEMGIYSIEDPTVTRKGQFKDVCLTENDRLLFATIFFDIETRQNQTLEKPINKLEWLCVCARVYVGGLLTDFRTFMIQLKSAYAITRFDIHEVGYKVLQSGTMYWGAETLGDTVSRRFFKDLFSMLTLLATVHGSAKFKKSATSKRFQYKKWLQNGFHLVGYNNNNFDNFGVMQEYILEDKMDELMTCSIIPSNGSNTKGFIVHTLGKYSSTLLSSNDLMEMVGPIPLSKVVKDYVSPLLGENPIDEYGLLTVWEKMAYLNTSIFGGPIDALSMFNQSMLDYKSPTNAEKRKIRSFFMFQCDPAFLGKIRTMASFWMFWKTLPQKKGCPPLKFFQKMSIEDYANLKSIQLSDYPLEDLFFKRELKSAKDMDLSVPYEVHKEMKLYCEQDVLLTEACCRVYNNALYNLAPSEFKNESGIQGFRTSMLRFKTLAAVSEAISVSLLPSECVMSKTKGMINTRLPLYTIEQSEQFRRIPGGKVIPRQIMWKSKDFGKTDYCCYLDSSGMYMAAMMKYEYPYGLFKKHFYKTNPQYMETLRESYNKGEGTTKCRFMYVTRSLNPKETEPAAGYRSEDKKKVLYVNHPINSWETNVSIMDILRSGGTLHRIWFCVEWEYQGKILENAMKVYDRYKNNSEGAQKALYKGIANRTYGIQLKKDTFSKMSIVKDPVELSAILQNSMIDMLQCIGNSVCINYSSGMGLLSKRCAHMGAFVLTYSRHDQNKAIALSYGSERFEDSNLKHMIRYGDTDSIVLDVKHVKNLIAHDRNQMDWNERYLFLPEVPKSEKAGKLTDELADDITKYIPIEEANLLLRNGFPDISTGFCGRVVETVSPRPKVNFVKVIFPPATWLGMECNALHYPEDTSLWHVAYKMTCKGIPAGSFVCIDGETEGVIFQPNEECFELLKRAVNTFKHVRCISKDRLKKISFRLFKTQQREGLIPFDITSVNEFERSTLHSLWDGREYIIKDIDGDTFETKYESYTVPLGYQEEPYTEEEIEACYEEASSLHFY